MSGSRTNPHFLLTHPAAHSLASQSHREPYSNVPLARVTTFHTAATPHAGTYLTSQATTNRITAYPREPPFRTFETSRGWPSLPSSFEAPGVRVPNSVLIYTATRSEGRRPKPTSQGSPMIMDGHATVGSVIRPK